MDLYGVNFLHHGAPKTWYCVPPMYAYKLEKIANKLFPGMSQVKQKYSFQYKKDLGKLLIFFFIKLTFSYQSCCLVKLIFLHYPVPYLVPSKLYPTPRMGLKKCHWFSTILYLNILVRLRFCNTITRLWMYRYIFLLYNKFFLLLLGAWTAKSLYYHQVCANMLRHKACTISPLLLEEHGLQVRNKLFNVDWLIDWFSSVSWHYFPVLRKVFNFGSGMTFFPSPYFTST